jgi:hypothetical protein
MENPMIIAVAAAALLVWGAVVFLRGGLLAGCLTVLLAATVFGDYFFNVPTSVGSLTQLVLFYLMPAGLYWVARQSRITPRGVRGMFIFLGLLGIYVVVTAIAEWQRQLWLVYPPYISSASDPAFIGRARGPMIWACWCSGAATAGDCGVPQQRRPGSAGWD